MRPEAGGSRVLTVRPAARASPRPHRPRESPCAEDSFDGEYSRWDMEWLWFVTVAGCLLALAALATARRLSRRLAQLSEQYWELKYEHGELKSRIKALAPTPEETAATRPPVQQTFVPLTSIKKK